MIIAVVGLGFGQDFVRICLSHPGLEAVVLVEPGRARRAEAAYLAPSPYRCADTAEALADDSVDAVHILSPVFTYADMAPPHSPPESLSPAPCRWRRRWMILTGSSLPNRRPVGRSSPGRITTSSNCIAGATPLR